jgi:hypothetical protein
MTSVLSVISMVRSRLLLIAVAVVMCAMPVAAQTAARYAGRSLADVLRDLQSLGLNVVFSSELVRPEMRVASEPKSTAPRKILDEVLEPHGLRAAAGPKGTWLVVRARRKTAAPAAPAIVKTGIIHGAIVDKRTGAPLPGVTVTIQGSPLTTVTGADGEFRLDQVPAEPQQLFVSLVGYGLARPFVNVEPERTSEVTIALADGVGSYVEEVTVVADRFRAGDPASPSRQTLTSAELRDLGSVLSDDPYRAMQALPGVAAGDDFRSEFSVRGSDFRHVGQSLDGVPMGWLVHSTRGTEDTNGSASILNGDVIDQAALNTGPYPQRQPAALGAWLSLDLREGSRTSTQGHLAVSGTAASFSADGPLGDSPRGSWLVSIRQSYLQWLLNTVNGDDDAAFGFADAEGKLVFDLTPAQQLQASVLAGRSKLDQTNADAGPNQAGSAIDRTGIVNLAWRSTFAKSVLTQRVAVVGADFVNHGRFNQDLGDGHSTTGWYLADVSMAAGHGLTFKSGGSLARQHAGLTQTFFERGPADGTVVLRAHDSFDLSSWLSHAYAGLSWQSSEGSAFDAGAAVGHSSGVEGTPVSPWAVASWPLGRGITVRGGASLAWQFPDVEQVAHFGGTGIRPERAVSVDASVERRLSPAIRWQVTFYSRSEHDVLRADGAEPRVVGGQLIRPDFVPMWRNALSGSAHGVELLVQERSTARLSGWIGYSYGRARYTDAGAHEEFWADFDQRHALNVYGQLRLSSRTSVSSKLRVGSNFPIAGYFTRAGTALEVGTVRNEERLPFYSRLDLRINHTFTYAKRRLSLFAEVLNAAARTNYGPVNGFVLPDRSTIGFTQSLLPLLPSAGFIFDF